MGHRAVMDGFGKFSFQRAWIPGLSSLWRVAISTTLSRLTNIPEGGFIPKTKFAPTNFYWRGATNPEVMYNSCLI